ncbi:hypothetical protein Asp14428_06760 [Actinoplanes sp. NBRC 14428]|nr:hypothetical protein Asp14428_06760 [Actinoplanes sp. NBRC 14428]
MESFSGDKLHGIRFLSANPLLVRTLAQDGNRIGTTLSTLVDALAALLPNPAPADVLHLRMALLSINAAVEAAGPDTFTDDDILAAAHRNATILIDALLARSATR